MDDTALTLPAASHLTIDHCISLWLAAKTKRTNSAQTKRAYENIIVQFRAALQAAGHDLDSSATLVSLVAQGWASNTQDGGAVAASTFNQRLAILSSFYRYAIPRGICVSNPIDLVERRPSSHPNAAMPLESEDAASFLQAIDRTTIEGQRDFTLLSIGLTTGRRASELAAMRWEHITVSSRRITVLWPRCKGAKVMRDVLSPNASKVLIAYLRCIYGENMEKIRGESPLWVSLSNNNRGGPLSTQAISDICKKRVGTSKVHTLRHTFSIAMEDAGAKLSEIGERLGHSNLKTTSDYMERLRSAENAHVSKLDVMFGIE